MITYLSCVNTNNQFDPSLKQSVNCMINCQLKFRLNAPSPRNHLDQPTLNSTNSVSAGNVFWYGYSLPGAEIFTLIVLTIPSFHF